MKKSDIKPGVIYAYNAGRRAPSYFSPAVVLSLDTYESSTWPRDGAPWLTPCERRDRKHGRRGGTSSAWDVGYPIAIGHSDEDHERLLALTADDLKTWVTGTADERYEGLRLKAAAGRELSGLWDEVTTQAEREMQVAREARAREAAANARTQEAAQERVSQLRALGLDVRDVSPFDRETWTHVRLTLAQVDDILARIGETPEETK